MYRDSWVHFEGAIEIIDRTPPTRLQHPSSGREMQIDSYIEYISLRVVCLEDFF